MGEEPRRRKTEVEALQAGLELGLTLIDTAEMYGDGGAERVVGEAIAGRRDHVFLVSKVLPEHATRGGTIEACERSLRRLKTTHLDLYLLHWREDDTPVADTVQAFETLQRDDKIRYWGVSNFDVSDVEYLLTLRDGGGAATDQVLYNLTRRSIEWELLSRGEALRMPIMAYSPIEQGRLLKHHTLHEIAARHSATPTQIALAWVLRRPDIIAIPKAGTVAHVRENAGALAVELTPKDLADLDAAFPPPSGPATLDML
jgi:diketogulonate reductase-like aldo/keto reductase